jgi:DNA polymerase-4
VEPVSVDEAFLDVTGSRRLFGDPRTIAGRIRAAVRAEVGLTASIGIAGNKFLAKVASEVAKPDGVADVPRDRDGMLAFLAPLPVGRLWGVGAVAREALERRGFRTVGDLQRAAEAAVAEAVGRPAAAQLLRLARGEDDRELVMAAEEKSISREHTFAEDCRDAERMRGLLRDLAEDVGRRLRESGRFAGVARLKLRWADFRTITRQRPFPAPVCDDFSLRRMALELFDAEARPQPVRLIGFGVTGLRAQRQEQPGLFADPADRRDRDESLCRAVDRLRSALGDASVIRAARVGRTSEA